MATPVPEAPAKDSVPPVIRTVLVEVARAVQLVKSGSKELLTNATATESVPSANSYVDYRPLSDPDVTRTAPAPVMGPLAITLPGS